MKTATTATTTTTTTMTTTTTLSIRKALQLLERFVSNLRMRQEINDVNFRQIKDLKQYKRRIEPNGTVFPPIFKFYVVDCCRCCWCTVIVVASFFFNFSSSFGFHPLKKSHSCVAMSCELYTIYTCKNVVKTKNTFPTKQIAQLLVNTGALIYIRSAVCSNLNKDTITRGKRRRRKKRNICIYLYIEEKHSQNIIQQFRECVRPPKGEKSK